MGFLHFPLLVFGGSEFCEQVFSEGFYRANLDERPLKPLKPPKGPPQRKASAFRVWLGATFWVRLAQEPLQAWQGSEVLLARFGFRFVGAW